MLACIDLYELTIELNNVVLDAFRERPVACRRCRRQQTLNLRLVAGVLHDEDQRNSKGGKDDGERAICPAPVILIESCRSGRAGVCGNDVWRRGESICETTVAKGRSVCGDDIDRKCHTGESDAIEDLRCAVNADALARSSQDQAECCETSHQRKSNGTIPEVENLRKWHVGSSSHNARNNLNKRDQRVSFELACDVRR